MSFDKNSTTDDVLEGIELTGKTALITGASSGIGAETARALAAHGAGVTLVARSADKLAGVADRIRSETGKECEVWTMELDKSDTVRVFASVWLSHHDKLDILINNAGIMTLPLTRTDEG